jgi:hypothetical protein
VGFELDEAVYEAGRRNLSILSLDLELLQVDYESGLRALAVAEDALLVVFVAPPWGDALDEATGLDLRRMSPSVTEIIDLITATLRATAAPGPDLRIHRSALTRARNSSVRMVSRQDLRDRRTGPEPRPGAGNDSLAAINLLA